MKKIKKLIILGCLVLLVSGCKNIFTVENNQTMYLKGKHNVEMSIKGYGKLEISLDADKAPITVTNFMKLVKSGFYDGNTIHRVAKNFVIQGGQGEGETIKGEFSANGKSNDISHVRGTISMARAGDTTGGFDTASTQFFIVQKDSTFLDNYFAGFGSVTKGMEVVDKICNSITNVDENGNILDAKDMPIIEYIKEIEK